MPRNSNPPVRVASLVPVPVRTRLACHLHTLPQRRRMPLPRVAGGRRRRSHAARAAVRATPAQDRPQSCRSLRPYDPRALETTKGRLDMAGAGRMGTGRGAHEDPGGRKEGRVPARGAGRVRRQAVAGALSAAGLAAAALSLALVAGGTGRVRRSDHHHGQDRQGLDRQGGRRRHRAHHGLGPDAVPLHRGLAGRVDLHRRLRQDLAAASRHEGCARVGTARREGPVADEASAAATGRSPSTSSRCTASRATRRRGRRKGRTWGVCGSPC